MNLSRSGEQSGKSSLPPARVGLIVMVGLIVISWVIASGGVGL